MPRLARLDSPGVLHHVIIRGIERRFIFKDDQDRETLVETGVAKPLAMTQPAAGSAVSHGEQPSKMMDYRLTE